MIILETVKKINVKFGVAENIARDGFYETV